LHEREYFVFGILRLGFESWKIRSITLHVLFSEIIMIHLLLLRRDRSSRWTT